MKLIVFCRKGEAISDFDIEKRVDDFLASERNFWRVSTQLIIDVLRVRIKENTIDIDSISVIVEDLAGDLNRFNIDKNGLSNRWIDSQDIHSELLSRILGF